MAATRSVFLFSQGEGESGFSEPFNNRFPPRDSGSISLSGHSGHGLATQISCTPPSPQGSSYSRQDPSTLKSGLGWIPEGPAAT